MKTETTIFIALILLIIVIFKRKGVTMKGNEVIKYSFDPTSKEYIKSQFELLKQDYAKEVVEKVEKVYRLETANFSSGQYRDSLSPGQVYSVDNDILPWNLNGYGVIGFSKGFTVGGKVYRYVAYENLYEAMRFLADYINRWNGNESRWFSTVPSQQANYRDKLNKISTRYA